MPDRDNLDSEDTVTVYLDTFHDQRRACFFTVNALGVQEDGVHSEAGFNAGTLSGGGLADKNPDFQFDSTGRLTDEGYVVEVRIPFKSLHYPANGPQKWGLQISRTVQRTRYQDTWTDARKAGESFLSQAGDIDGLHDLQHGVVTEIQPFFTMAANGSRQTDGAPFVRDKMDINPGANVRFSTTNLTFDSTVNPDFSQVEADAGQVTANERFALFYPEKRTFFLEGIDLFATPNQLAYTRQIVNPIAGEKLTGKVGPLNVAYLVVKEKVDSGGALFNVARIRRDFGHNSTVGMTVTDRSARGEYNRVIDADIRTIFKKLYYFQVQAAQSWTQDPGGKRHASPLWMVEWDRTGRAFGFNYKLTGIGTNFQARAGYIPRNNIVQGQLFNRYSWYGKKGSLLETVSAHYNLTRVWEYDEFGRRRAIEGTDSYNLQSGWRGGWTLNGNLKQMFWRFEPELYAAYQVVARNSLVAPYLPLNKVSGLTPVITIKTPIFRTVNGQLDFQRGPVPIFAEGSAGHQTRIATILKFRPIGSLRAEVTSTYVRITHDRDGSESVRTVIPRFKVEYQATRSLFFRMVAEYRSERQALLLDAIGGDPLLIGGVLSAARLSKGVRLDWLVSYKPTPFTVAFFGYGSSLATDHALSLSSLQRMNDGFFLKLAYQIRK
ncbi:MAG: hypothetical protein IMZ55_01080 [Acidobacteria bacterium]|nr:hypothetical protein [Acidobacteriota bacterium]